MTLSLMKPPAACSGQSRNRVEQV